MTTLELLNVLRTKSSEIIENTLKLLPQALAGDNCNRSFYFNEKGQIDYDVSIGQHHLSDEYFFTIQGYETPDAGDYDYINQEEMLNDEEFLDTYYRDIIEESINNCIIAFEVYN